jgi:hypothetical protein
MYNKASTTRSSISPESARESLRGSLDRLAPFMPPSDKFPDPIQPKWTWADDCKSKQSNVRSASDKGR